MTTFIFLELLASILVAILSFVIPLKLPELKWIRLYCLTNVIADIIGDILALKGINNIALIHVLIVIEIYLLFQFFSTISAKIAKISKFKFYFITYLLLFGIILFIKKPFEFNPYTLIFEGLLIFSFSIIYFLEELKSPTSPFIYQEPDFWFSAGFLLYYSGTWFILLGIQYFVIEPKMFVYIWDGHNILNILKNIAIAIGLICSRRD